MSVISVRLEDKFWTIMFVISVIMCSSFSMQLNGLIPRSVPDPIAAERYP